MEFKEIAELILLFAIFAGWMSYVAVSAYKEKNRHSEVTECVQVFLKRMEKDTANVAQAINKIIEQKTLMIVKDEDGNLEVRALNVATQEEVVQALKKQEQSDN
ncbi:MAG: hypothetical protein LBV80_08140 [Deltaproteobacteria bacterium]|jgi:hypothetical protein|nr:hypothetical protein [Deltaproteobacteria bacterium]